MATLNFFNILAQDLAKGNHKMSSDVVKVMFTNTAPVATNAIKADITEIAGGNGYTSGGTTVGTMTVGVGGAAQTGKVTVSTANLVFTASGGSIATFRYVVLFNDTTASPVKPLIGWLDYGSAVTPATGETFTVQFDTTNGLFTIN